VRADLEVGIPMPDASVDMVTSVSSIEHLSGHGQVLFLREAGRVLRPGGIVAITVSYLIDLNDRKLEVLSSNPVLKKEGFTISSELNLRQMLESAPSLAPPEPPDWSRFPGYHGFDPESLLTNRDIILDKVHMDPTLPSASEVNSLDIRWAEIGIFLMKSRNHGS
jgi:SAM-dependent methyltransferase